MVAEASIEEVREELHQVQNRIRVLRLSIVGVDPTDESLKLAVSRCEVVSDILDAVNVDLTRSTNPHEAIP